MNRNEVIARIKAAEPALRASGVDALFLYGSYSRDEAGPDSDVDILVELAPGRESKLSTYLAPYHILEQRFPGIEIGYGTRENLVSHYRSHIEQTAVRIF
jgi:uncharacterized protein